MINKEICYYDKEGVLINIGPWDYIESPVYDDDGFLIEIRKDNTPPDGFYTVEQDVITNDDGSRSIA
ncbi:TPA: hypothetical protein OND32_002377 [Enterobacter asburiae]|nr:hypothetical protein [Enterobacter asburiae]